MRVEVRAALTAAIGALFISIGFPALARHDGGQSYGEQEQGKLERPPVALRLARLTERRAPDEQQADTDGPRQPEAMKDEIQQDERAPADTGMPRDPKWTALTETNLGTTMDFPRAVFSMDDGPLGAGMGRKYRTLDGRAKVAVWTQRNTSRDTPAGYLRRTFAVPHDTVDYERFTPNFGVVSGAYGGRIYYIRCNLSPQGNLHCFDLAYPLREKKAWDAVVTRMSRSLRPASE